jgi:hypothetical protein
MTNQIRTLSDLLTECRGWGHILIYELGDGMLAQIAYAGGRRKDGETLEDGV